MVVGFKGPEIVGGVDPYAHLRRRKGVEDVACHGVIVGISRLVAVKVDSGVVIVKDIILDLIFPCVVAVYSEGGMAGDGIAVHYVAGPGIGTEHYSESKFSEGEVIVCPGASHVSEGIQ